MRKARIKYNDTYDAYDVEINTGDGWGLDRRYHLQKSIKKPEEETCMISYQFIIKMSELQSQGYTINFTWL